MNKSQDELEKYFTPKLQKGEYKFKKAISYKLKDFNFDWDISYFRVIYFVEPYGVKEKKLSYAQLDTIFKSDDRELSEKEKKNISYFANLMKSRKNYDMKISIPPFGAYRYFVVSFINSKGKMFALESKKELKEMLGKIDTPAEILLWIRINYWSFPYSYYYKDNIWQIRNSGWTMDECDYLESVKYYDSNGKSLKYKELRSYHKEGCEIILDAVRF